jgi:hypothetical protein
MRRPGIGAGRKVNPEDTAYHANAYDFSKVHWIMFQIHCVAFFLSRDRLMHDGIQNCSTLCHLVKAGSG